MRKLLLLTIGFIAFIGVLSAQELTVTGKLTDADDGLEIIGATVIIKGNPSSGTISDLDGNYQISASSNDTLVFSYIGYESYLRVIFFEIFQAYTCWFIR